MRLILSERASDCLYSAWDVLLSLLFVGNTFFCIDIIF